MRKQSKKFSKEYKKFKQEMKKMGMGEVKLNIKEVRPHLSRETSEEISIWYQPKGNKLVSNLVSDFMAWGNYRIPAMIYKDLNQSYIPKMQELRGK